MQNIWMEGDECGEQTWDGLSCNKTERHHQQQHVLHVGIVNGMRHNLILLDVN